MFDDRVMLDMAAQPAIERTGVVRHAAGLPPSTTSTRPTLPVAQALRPVLPGGLRRGSTVAVTGSMSLLLAVLGAASAEGSWCALVGLPRISAEAAGDHGIELSRLPLVPDPGADWATVVGALLDAVDVVAARPPQRLSDGDVRRLAARARSRGAVLVPFLAEGTRWPGADIQLSTMTPLWCGIGAGYGRLRQRRLTVTAAGRGTAARPRTATLWLPAAAGNSATCPPEPAALAPVYVLTERTG